MKISKLSVCIKGLIELLSCEKDTIKDVGALSLKSVLIHVPISHLELSTVIIYSLPALLSNLKSVCTMSLGNHAEPRCQKS